MQAIPSPLPIAPMPSLVDALTFTGAERTPVRQRGDLRLVGGELRLLADHRHVDVRDRAGHPADDDPQQVDRVRVAPLLLVVREELAEIAEAAGAEQRVDHRVGEDVGVRVAG